MPAAKGTPNGGRGKGPASWESVAFTLLGGILIGTASGMGLDYLLHTAPLFLIIGIFLGFALGLYGIYKGV